MPVIGLCCNDCERCPDRESDEEGLVSDRAEAWKVAPWVDPADGRRKLWVSVDTRLAFHPVMEILIDADAVAVPDATKATADR